MIEFTGQRKFDRRHFLRKAGGVAAIGILPVAGLGSSECDEYPYYDNLPEGYSKNPTDYKFVITIDVGQDNNVFLYSNQEPRLSGENGVVLEAKDVYCPDQNYLWRQKLALSRAYMPSYKLASPKRISVRPIAPAVSK